MTATYSNPVDYLDHFLLSATLLWLAVDAYGWYNLISRPSPFMFALNVTIIPLLAIMSICMEAPGEDNSDARRLVCLLMGNMVCRRSQKITRGNEGGGENVLEGSEGGSESGTIFMPGEGMVRSLQKTVGEVV
ncbi:hypothetical protein LTR56_019109 [Elasticomyces elasticus]|nr:hypothetical protein LTR56_019109 [Elasticomyces elasticus]KAK3635481.1 hypothetical protein LTR22_019161 [Elasticomyces elasticus]KAK4911609.1 hypothetical protein LTR49_019859 [Elasticomyces elasticus]KAK5765634.1 hypothetical protein LTS12_004138 [Elasticomyces elasticus]